MTYFNSTIDGSTESQASATKNVDELGTVATASVTDKMHTEWQLAQRFLRELMVTYAKLHNADLDRSDLTDADLIPRFAREANLTEREAVVDILRMWDALNQLRSKMDAGCDHAE